MANPITLYPGGDQPVTPNLKLALNNMSLTSGNNFEILDAAIGAGPLGNVVGNPTTGALTINGSSLTNLFAMKGTNDSTLGDGTVATATVIPSGGNFLVFDISSGSQWRIGGGGLQSVQRAPIQFGSPVDGNISSIGAASFTMGNGVGNNASAKLTLGDIVLTVAAPTVAAAQVGFGGTVSATASVGGITPPATVAGYLIVNVAGTQVKVPYYAN
jgi:hypothetical protein